MSYLSNEQKEVAAQALATDPVWQRQIWEPQSILFQGLHWLSSCFTFCFHPDWVAGEEDGSILNSDCTGSSRNTRQAGHGKSGLLSLNPTVGSASASPPPSAGAGACVSVLMSSTPASRSTTPGRLPTPQSHRVTPAGSLARAALGCERR